MAPPAVRPATCVNRGESKKYACLGRLHSFSKNPSRLQQIPSRAVLARKWPSLKLNRYTGAWRDDATGARGDDVETLLAVSREARIEPAPPS